MTKFDKFDTLSRVDVDEALENVHPNERWKFEKVLEQLDSHAEALAYAVSKIQFHDEFLDYLGHHGKAKPEDIADFFRWKEAKNIVDKMFS